MKLGQRIFYFLPLWFIVELLFLAGTLINPMSHASAVISTTLGCINAIIFLGYIFDWYGMRKTDDDRRV